MAEDQENDGLRYFRIDWEKKLNERFPEGITPIETPFMAMMAKKPPKRPKPKPGY